MPPAGDVQRGVATVAAGAAWVRNTARDPVPPEFVESFLHRNPVNQQLLALTASHRASGES